MAALLSSFKTQVPETKTDYSADGLKATQAAYETQTTVDDDPAALDSMIDQLTKKVDAPQFVTAVGQFIGDENGSLYNLGPNGEVYCDAMQMPGLTASRIAIVGRAIYGKGKTSGSWYRWNRMCWDKVVAPYDGTTLS